jgi:formate C-acetyltransferase
VLDYDEVRERLDVMMDWLAQTYVDALNVIHYMHDKYAYERLEMALHDGDVLRTMACGIAGLSVAADSLSAIRHAVVRPGARRHGLAVDFDVEGDFPPTATTTTAADSDRRRPGRDVHGEDPRPRPTGTPCTPSPC